MCKLPFTVMKLEQHGIRDMKTCKLVEGTGRHDDLSAIVEVLTTGGHHGDGVTTVILVETACDTRPADGTVVTIVSVAAVAHGGSRWFLGGFRELRFGVAERISAVECLVER